jgi:hypothetical protein
MTTVQKLTSVTSTAAVNTAGDQTAKAQQAVAETVAKELLSKLAQGREHQSFSVKVSLEGVAAAEAGTTHGESVAFPSREELVKRGVDLEAFDGVLAGLLHMPADKEVAKAVVEKAAEIIKADPNGKQISDVQMISLLNIPEKKAVFLVVTVLGTQDFDSDDLYTGSQQNVLNLRAPAQGPWVGLRAPQI